MLVLEEEMTKEELMECARDKRMAEAIIGGINQGGAFYVYASDGKGVRTVNDLLSEDQLADLECVICNYLNDLITDCQQILEGENEH